jgi:hypothetical protein
MTVTPPSPDISTSFITFTSTNITLEWQTNNNSQAGIYTVVIRGAISAASTWMQSTSFTLTVIASCSYSSETILITADTPITTLNYALAAS